MFFGNIRNGKMELNDMGRIVRDEFFKSFEIHNELFLGAFVLMPNHLHAIVILDKPNCTDDVVETRGCVEMRDRMETCGRVETHVRASLHSSPSLPSLPSSPSSQPSPMVAVGPQFQRQPKSISSFVAGFKSATVKRIDDWIDSNNLPMAKFNRNNPLWQANYHDHIIRDETEYRNIADYIIDNPKKWNSDSIKPQ